MKEERLMILKMIDEGKISADDGVKLLKALSKSGDAEEKITKAAKKLKNKVSDIAKEAEPKVKKAAQELKVKGGEVANEIGDKIKAQINKAKDTCDCDGEIIEAEDIDYSFDYEDETEVVDSEDEDGVVASEDEDEEKEEKTDEETAE